jgi:hypothetical protein
MFLRMLAGVSLLLVGSAAAGGDLRPNEMIIGGGCSECDGSEGMWVSSPSLFLRRDTPGIMVGMVKPPGSARRYSYVFVIKGDERRTILAQYDAGDAASGDTGVRGAWARSHGSLEIARQKVSFEYNFEADRAGKQLVEKLSINAKSVDLEKGRVFLVDLSPGGGKWTQVRVDLAESPSYPRETDKVEAQARDMLKHLRERSEAVRKFLK